MPAFACLRVDLPDSWAKKLEVIGGQLEKIVELYLEARWSWPRKFSPLNALNFLLSDPRAAQLDPAELCRLSDQLQQHLFGAAADGEVALLLFEGPAEAVIRFAAFKTEEVMAAILDPELLPQGGRLTRIRPNAPPEIAAVAPSARPAAKAAAPAPASGGDRGAELMKHYRVGLIGTYLLGREVFTADLLAVAPVGETHHYATVEGQGALPPDEMLFDEVCIRGVPEVLARKAGRLPLGVPIAYSSFVRPEQTRRLAQLLPLLPKDRRQELNASVYGLPRHLPGGVAQLKPLLDPWFCTINLIVADAAFELAQLGRQQIGCVVLCVREKEATARQAAIRAFAARSEAYRHRGVRQVLANLRTRAELELAARLELPLVSGPAVGGFLETPVGGRPVPLEHLPFIEREEQARLRA